MEIIAIPHPCAPGARQLKELLAGRARVGFDIETDSSRPDRVGGIVCWQVSDGQRCFVVDARAWPVAEAAAAAWIGDANAEKAIHNATFEAGVLARQGLVLRGGVDTLVLARLLSAGVAPAQMHSIGLGGLSLAALVEHAWGVKLDKSLQRSFRSGARLSAEQTAYAAADAYWALALAERLEKQVALAGLVRVAKLEQRAARVAERMSRVGVPVDAEAWWETCDSAGRRAGEAARRAADALGVPVDLFGEHTGFLVDSPAQVGAAFARAGVDLPVKDSGAYEVGEDVLVGIEHPAAKALLEYRHAKKVADWALVPDAGRIYPTWKALGAATGRMAASRPNVMAIPKALSSAVAAGEGRALVSVDYRNQELYILADLSGDAALADALGAGDDPYMAVARRLGVDRKTAKVVTLAAAYGAGDAELGSVVGGDDADGAALKRSLRKAYPQAMGYCGSVRTAAAPDAGTGLLAGAPGARELRAGGRRRLVVGQRQGAFIGNTPVQATAATMTKLALVRACRGIVEGGGEIVLAIHDEVVAEVPQEGATAALHVVEEAMRSAARDTVSDGALAPPVKGGEARTLAEARASA